MKITCESRIGPYCRLWFERWIWPASAVEWQWLSILQEEKKCSHFLKIVDLGPVPCTTLHMKLDELTLCCNHRYLGPLDFFSFFFSNFDFQVFDIFFFKC
uniref:Uncharacterized protein n=1 Tax=Cacopsylla melanoneura TaxID=428564 RepID=A0A8D9A3N4_9HEMI